MERKREAKLRVKLFEINIFDTKPRFAILASLHLAIFAKIEGPINWSLSSDRFNCDKSSHWTLYDNFPHSEKESYFVKFSEVGRSEEPGFIPAHVALDKKVLHFKGYFTEEIIDSPVESDRVRYLDIFYYLVDDSVAMSEPQQENSGITQGKFLTRQRLPLGQGDRLLSWKNLNTAMDLIVYSKVLKALLKLHVFHNMRTRDIISSL